ncbi:MAG: glycosyl transferase family 2 [Desulfurococcales archaeon ex4484_217_2]|nr:MAG: glycosyl transferase family 2 [Desulfurococcales archaeon ex4484_217_2]
MDEPLVSIVVPTYNRREKLARLIRSILENDYPKDKLEIIVIDDASSDGTYENIKRLFPQVKIIRNDEEKLLAESRNIGIRASRGKYIFVIDDDNVIDKNAIKELIKFMEKHPEVGVAGPIMYFLNDPTRIWCAGVKRSYWTTITKLIGFNTRDNGRLKEPYESEDFPNAFIIRRELFGKVGLFNSKIFPIHYDEGDLCQRVRKAGYKVVVVPTVKVWHDIPLPEQSRVLTLHLKNPLRAYYTIRNRILFHAMWSRRALQRYVALLASLVITAYYMVIALKDITDNKHEVIKSMFKGIIDGFKLMKEVVSH